MGTRESPLDQDRARDLLSRARERIEKSLTAQERIRRGDIEEIETATDVADDAGLIEEEQVDDALVEQLREELEAVDRALKRLADGSYGFSIESGDPIPAGRLEAIPWAERTAEEQERYER